MPLSINDGFEIKAPRYADLRQGKIVDGKSVPYDYPEEILDLVPITRRIDGFPFYVKGDDGVEIWYMTLQSEGWDVERMPLSDEKNRKGYFVDETDLNTKYPEPIVGWYAYVGSTGTIWVEDDGSWVDSEEDIPADVDLSGIATKDDIQDLTKEIETNYLTDNAQNGYYDTSGDFVEAENWRSVEIDTKTKKKFNIKISIIGTSAVGIGGFNGDNNFIILEQASYNGNYVVTEGIERIVVSTQATTSIEFYVYGILDFTKVRTDLEAAKKEIALISPEVSSNTANIDENSLRKVTNLLTSNSLHGYYNTLGIFNPAENWRSVEVDTTEHKDFDIKVVITGTSAAVVGWKVDNTVVVLIQTSFEGSISVDSDIVRIGVTSKAQPGDAFYLFDISEKKTLGEWVGIFRKNIDIDTANGKVNLLSDQDLKGYFDTYGKFNSSENWRSAEIDTSAHKEFSIKTVMIGTSAVSIGGITENGVYSILEQPSYNDQYTVPEGIVKILLTTRALPGDIFYCYSLPIPDRTLGQWVFDTRQELRRLKENKEDKSESPRKLLSYIPDVAYAVRGEPLRIYPYNLINVNEGDLSVDVFLDQEYANEKASFFNNPQLDKTLTYKIRNYDGLVDNLGEIELKVLEPTNPDDKLYILHIGDSLTQAQDGLFINELSRLLTGVGDPIANGQASKNFDNIEFIGTMGSRPVKFEGRGGWSLNSYLNYQTYGSQGLINAFYNPSKSKFDLDYYLSENDFYTKGVSPDGDNLLVTIMLNWNSVYTHTDSQFLTWYNEILTLIHSSHPECKIGIFGINTPPNKIYKSFTGVRDVSRASVMNDCIRIEHLLDEIANNTNNIPFVKHFPILPFFCADETAYPTNSTLKRNLRNPDTSELYFTDHVHPDTLGYGQIADIFYRAICSYLV